MYRIFFDIFRQILMTISAEYGILKKMGTKEKGMNLVFYKGWI